MKIKRSERLIGLLVFAIALIYFTFNYFGITGPPIVGDDKNNNGIWDDVEPFITKHARNENQRKALQYDFKSMQEVLINPEIGLKIRDGSSHRAPKSAQIIAKAKLLNIDLEGRSLVHKNDTLTRSNACLNEVYGGIDWGFGAEDIEEAILTNHKRIRAYIKYNGNLSGGSYTLWNRKLQGDPCPFKR